MSIKNTQKGFVGSEVLFLTDFLAEIVTNIEGHVRLPSSHMILKGIMQESQLEGVLLQNSHNCIFCCKKNIFKYKIQ
jgi:hypothetical protein